MKTRTYTTTIPYTEDTDLALLRWLTRESFESKIAADNLLLVTYAEQDVDPATIPAATLAAFPDHKWRQFTAEAKLPAHLEALLG